MTKKNNTAEPTLDLGIGELLSRADPTQQPTTSKQDPAAVATDVITLDEEVKGFSDEYTTLAQARQWGILVGKAETAIASEEDLEARLWWIRAHLGAFSLPVSLLAAPFETLCRQLCSHPNETEIYRPLLIEVGELMRERLRSIGDRRQEHVVALALNQLGLLDVDEKTRAQWTQMPSKVPRFELGKPEQEATVEAPSVAPVHSTRWRGALFTAIVLLLCGVAVGLAVRRHSSASEVVVASEGLVASSTVPALMEPIVEARGLQGDLGAIYYSISDARGAGPMPGDRPVAPDSGRSDSPPTLTGGNQKVPAQEKPSPLRKEVVNTDGPIEGSEFQRGVEPRAGLDARSPGPSRETLPEPLPSNSMPEIGGTVLGEVKSVIVSTNVLDSPSYRARILGRLREGDKVSVEAHNGQWLRIRSLKGRTGYVFAQDIGEPEDFAVPQVSGREP